MDITESLEIRVFFISNLFTFMSKNDHATV